MSKIKNSNFVNIQVKTKDFFELTRSNIHDMGEEKTIVRLVDGDRILRTFKGIEAKSAIVSLALDSNGRVFLRNIDDLLRTVKDIRFWNNKKMFSDKKRGFVNG
ncbi:hypothetical protein EBR43_03800 [bacterium]|nr:hypothetical protein [bacterium]